LPTLDCPIAAILVTLSLMNIRWKVTVLIAALFAVLGVTVLFVAKTILVPSFAELEHTDADIAMRRVKYALDSTLDQLASSAGGWGNWTDAYRFMQDHNRTFVNEQITIEGLKQLNINALMFFDLKGQYVASISHDFNSERPLILDFMQGTALAANFPWRDNLGKSRTSKGLLQTNRGTVLIAAARMRRLWIGSSKTTTLRKSIDRLPTFTLGQF
jgi:sensor domain CHASE-containing protein